MFPYTPLIWNRDIFFLSVFKDIDKGVFAVVERLFDELCLPDASASGYDGEFRPLMRRFADSPLQISAICDL